MSSEEEECWCYAVRRVMDLWKCVKCGREFVPKKRKKRAQRTKE